MSGTGGEDISAKKGHVLWQDVMREHLAAKGCSQEQALAQLGAAMVGMLRDKKPLHSIEEVEALATERPDLLALEVELLASVGSCLVTAENPQLERGDALLTSYMQWLLSTSEVLSSTHDESVKIGNDVQLQAAGGEDFSDDSDDSDATQIATLTKRMRRLLTGGESACSEHKLLNRFECQAKFRAPRVLRNDGVAQALSFLDRLATSEHAPMCRSSNTDSPMTSDSESPFRTPTPKKHSKPVTRSAQAQMTASAGTVWGGHDSRSLSKAFQLMLEEDAANRRRLASSLGDKTVVGERTPADSCAPPEPDRALASSCPKARARPNVSPTRISSSLTKPTKSSANKINKSKLCQKYEDGSVKEDQGRLLTDIELAERAEKGNQGDLGDSAKASRYVEAHIKRGTVRHWREGVQQRQQKREVRRAQLVLRTPPRPLSALLRNQRSREARSCVYAVEIMRFVSSRVGRYMRCILSSWSRSSSARKMHAAFDAGNLAGNQATRVSMRSLFRSFSAWLAASHAHHDCLARLSLPPAPAPPAPKATYKAYADSFEAAADATIRRYAQDSFSPSRSSPDRTDDDRDNTHTTINMKKANGGAVGGGIRQVESLKEHAPSLAQSPHRFMQTLRDGSHGPMSRSWLGGVTAGGAVGGSGSREIGRLRGLWGKFVDLEGRYVASQHVMANLVRKLTRRALLVRVLRRWLDEAVSDCCGYGARMLWRRRGRIWGILGNRLYMHYLDSWQLGPVFKRWAVHAFRALQIRLYGGASSLSSLRGILAAWQTLANLSGAVSQQNIHTSVSSREAPIDGHWTGSREVLHSANAGDILNDKSCLTSEQFGSLSPINRTVADFMASPRDSHGCCFCHASCTLCFCIAVHLVQECPMQKPQIRTQTHVRCICHKQVTK